MDTEILKSEIRALLERMGFAEDLENIEVHEGATSRFGIRLKNTMLNDESHTFEDNEEHGGRISSSDLLIGERGNGLSALEHLLKKIIRKKSAENYKFMLDINDYRIKRLDGLKQDIKAAAKEVLLYKKEVPLRSMSSFERRIVHLVLAEYPDITTESIGQEPNRCVVIKPYP